MEDLERLSAALDIGSAFDPYEVLAQIERLLCGGIKSTLRAVRQAATLIRGSWTTFLKESEESLTMLSVRMAYSISFIKMDMDDDREFATLQKF